MKNERYEAWELIDVGQGNTLDIVPSFASGDPVTTVSYLQLISTEFHRQDSWVNIMLHGMGVTLHIEGQQLEALPKAIMERRVQLIRTFDPSVHERVTSNISMIEKITFVPSTKSQTKKPKSPPLPPQLVKPR